MPAPSTRHIEPLLALTPGRKGRRPGVNEASRRTYVQRSRAKHIRLVRAPSTPTPTPLVRNRVKVVDDARPNTWAKLGRARRRKPNLSRNQPPPPPKRTVIGIWLHGNRRNPLGTRRRHPTHALVVRAPSTPTPTPLVRNRVQVFEDRRAGQWVKLGRLRRRKPNVVRNPMPAPPVRTIIGPTIKPTNRAHRWNRYGRGRRRDHATIVRAPSVPTPTPLVRNRVHITEDLRPQRFARLGRIRRRKPNLSSSILLPKPINTVAPAVTGNNWVGQTLTCTTGTWLYAGAFSFQWYSDTLGDNVYLPLGGATSSTYVLTAGEVGDHLLCVVTTSDLTGTTTASSNSTAIILTFPPRGVLTPLEPTVAGLRRTGGVTNNAVLVTGTPQRIVLRMTNGGGTSATITLKDAASAANDLLITLGAGQVGYVALRHRPHFVQAQDGYLIDCSTSSVTFEAVAI